MLCVLFICVLLWEIERTLHVRKDAWELLGSFFSHRAHRVHGAFGARFEPTEGLRHTEFTEAFQLRLAVTLCVIGWLNVSVECCVFCSSVFFCEKKNIVGVCVDSFFSHRAHRVHGAFRRTFRAHRRPPAYRGHRGLSTKISCNALWYRLT